MPTGIACSTLPFGPSTTTVLPCTEYFTPLGSGIGFFPIRDITSNPLRLASPDEFLNSPFHCSPGRNLSTQLPLFFHANGVTTSLCSGTNGAQRACVPGRLVLPDFAENLAANAFTARLASGHHAPRRGEDADAESALHALDLIAAHVNAAAGTRHTSEVADRSLVVRAVLEVHTKDRAAVFFGRLVAGDIALFFENAGYFGLQLRGRNIQLLVTRTNRIAN